MRNRAKKESQNPAKETSNPSKETPNSTKSASGFSWTLWLAVLVLIVIGVAAFLHFQPFKVPVSQNRPSPRDVNPVRSQSDQKSSPSDKDQIPSSKSSTQPTKKSKRSLVEPKKVFTLEELSHYDGTDPSEPLYLAIFGEVFDVSKGHKHYGKDRSYNGFTGKDGTRAFVTGEFTESGLRPDLIGLQPKQVADLWGWKDFYRKEYIYIGKLQGLYYDEKGEPTEKISEVQGILKEAARLAELDNQEKTKWPGCNSRWEVDTGGEIWCENMSGGIQRDWDGWPRKRYVAGEKSYRCVCVREDLLNDPTLQEYPDCPSTSHRCKVDLTPNVPKQ